MASQRFAARSSEREEIGAMRRRITNARKEIAKGCTVERREQLEAWFPKAEAYLSARGAAYRWEAEGR